MMMTQPNVENLKKQAKSLHKKLLAGDGESVSRVRSSLPRLSAVAEDDVASAEVTLQEVQHVIAVEQGFGNWKQMLTSAGQPARLKPPVTGYLRPGLPNVRREAEWFHDMIHQDIPTTIPGKGWSMDRIRKGLPRVADLSDEEIARAGVTLEEAQWVVAHDYGYPDWSTLEQELGGLHPVQVFEDFAGLEDEEIRQFIFRIGRDRLAVALKTASERLMERIRTNMSSSAWAALVEAMEALGPLPASRVETEQARVLEKYRSDDSLVSEDRPVD